MIIALLILILLAILDPKFTAGLIGLALLIGLVGAVLGAIALGVSLLL